MTDIRARDDDDALNRFWNALIQSEQQAAADLTPETMEVVHRLQRAGSAPLAGPPAGEVWPDVLARIEANHIAKEHTMTTTTLNGTVPSSMASGGHAARAGIPPGTVAAPRLPQRWAWGQLATAALVLLTLAASIVAFGWLRATPSERPALLPAAMATATTEISQETLFSITLPAEMIPIADQIDFIFWNMIIAPDTRAPFTDACCAGPMVTYVREGELTLTVDGALQIYRGPVTASTAPEAVNPGTAVVLRAGDTALYDYQSPAELANLGSDPLKVVSSNYREGILGAPPSDMVTFTDFTDLYPATPLPAVPVLATLERITLPAKGETAVPPAGSLVIQVGVEKDVSIGEQSDGSLRNVGKLPVELYVMTLTPLEAGEATPAA